MFTYQSPQINQALWLAGLSNQSVSTFQNLVGQCRAPLTHRGPVQFDYTRPDMRLITPDSGARFAGGPLDPPQDFPEQKQKPDEGLPKMPPDRNDGPFLPPEHNPNETPPQGGDGPPQYRPPAPPSLTAGPYIRIEDNQVSLRSNDPRRHCVFPAGLNVNDTINSIDFKGSGNKPEYIDLEIKDNARDTTFNIKVDKLENITVLTGASLAGGVLSFSRKSVWVFEPIDTVPDEIPTTSCEEVLP